MQFLKTKSTTRMISIIIPLYNKAKSIIQTIESIITQNYDNFEVIIVDDGSTDNGASLIESLHNKQISILKKTNGGPASARNYGVLHASGEYIIFLDADDTLEPGALKKFAQIASEHPNCSFFCGNHYVRKNGKKRLFSTHFREGFVFDNFFAYHCRRLRARAGTIMISRSLALKHPYNESYRRYEDADAIFAIMRNEKCYVTSTPVMTYNCDFGDASAPRKDINEDFLSHISYKGKSCWEQLALFYLYQQGTNSYPGQLESIYSDKKMYNLKVRICSYIIVFLEKIGYIRY